VTGFNEIALTSTVQRMSEGVCGWKKVMTNTPFFAARLGRECKGKRWKVSSYF